MKIIRRVGILVILSACFFIVEKDDVAYAQTSCPERDQCRDAALATYSEEIYAANLTYLQAVQDATMQRDSCLNPAEQENAFCRQQADDFFELQLGRCTSIPDPDDSQFCINEIEGMRQNDYANCDYTLQMEVDACWQNIYYPLTQQAQAAFFVDSDRAQEHLNSAYSGCDLIVCE